MEFKNWPPVVVFVFGFLLASGIGAYAFWSWYGHLPSQVADMRGEIELLSMQGDSANLHQLSLDKLDFKIDQVEKDIRGDYDWLQKVGLPLTLIALGALFLSLYKSALGFALQKAKENIDRYYLPDEERFKREKKLLILTKEGGDSGFIRKLIHDTGFDTASTIPHDNIKILDEKTLAKILNNNSFDLILMNSETVAFEDSEVRICYSNTPEFTMIFSFNKNLPPDIVSSPRVASASFKSQIYGNLVNSLKYQQYLRKSVKEN